MTVSDDRFGKGFVAGMEAARGKLCTGADGMPFWQTEPCPPWCTTRHEDGDAYNDRIHYSDQEVLKLALQDATSDGPEDLSMTLCMHYRESEPRMEINQDGRVGVHLRFDEAQNLIATIGCLTQRGQHITTEHDLRAVA